MGALVESSRAVPRGLDTNIGSRDSRSGWIPPPPPAVVDTKVARAVSGQVGLSFVVSYW